MKHIFHLFFTCLTVTLFSQSNDSGMPSIFVKKINEKIILDGNLDESFWKQAVPAKEFWQKFPADSLQAEAQTEVYMAYDAENLYVAVKCFAKGNDYVVPSLKRDYRAGGSDNITLVFDPFKDNTNAFVFGTNPYGVRREALISNGGSEGRHFQESWDNKWNGEAKIHEGYWAGEFAIPFKSIRYKEGSNVWGFNCYRFDTQSNEQSTWNQIPRNQIIMSLAYMGEIHWEEPLQKAGANFTVIPYAAGGLVQDFESNNSDPTFTSGFGADAKVGITSGLNLDLTANPDFSQVEVDRQVTNLDRFEIFFPERRQFFLENADLFSDFGISRINPFFSRRIGVALDTLTDSNIPNTIYFGARLSGKLDKNWRVGLLNMQTAKDDKNGLPSYNYTVAAVQRKIFNRSNIGLIFVNKENFTQDDGAEIYDPYNRIAGIDYNLASKDNKWTGKIFYHQAITPDQIVKNKGAHGTEINYIERNYSLGWNHQWVGDGFDAQVGFVPRNNYFRINPEVRLFFYPKKGIVNQHGPSFEFTRFWSPELSSKTDHQIDLSWRFQMSDSGRFNVSIKNNYTFLQDDFDPTGLDVATLPALSDYSYTNIEANYRSDSRKKFFFDIRPTIGQYFNGTRIGVRGAFTYRYQPFGSISINYSYNRIDLPDPFIPVNLYLVGPRIDLTFTRQIFLTTFIQYNSQIDNINVNARLQWRFAPVSDFFLVYTDNYYANVFGVKNRAIVAKLTYWLNL